MGSNVHRWSMALCAAMGQGISMVTEGAWVWEDQRVCESEELTHPLSCYFGDVGCRRTEPEGGGAAWIKPHAGHFEGCNVSSNGRARCDSPTLYISAPLRV